MNNSTIIECYKIIGENNVEELGDIIKGFTNNQYIYKIHRILSAYVFNDNGEDLNIKLLTKLVIEDAPTNTSKLRVYLNKLQQIIKEYIVTREYKKKNIYTEILWGDILIKNKAKRSLKLKKNTFTDELQHGLSSFLGKKQNDKEYLNYELLELEQNKSKNIVEAIGQNRKSIENLYFFEMLEFFHLSLNLNNKYPRLNFEIDYKKLNSIIREAATSQNQVLNIYAQHLNLKINPNDKNYNKLYEIFFQLEPKLGAEIKHNFATILLNHVINKLNTGASGLNKIMLDLLERFEEIKLDFHSFNFYHIHLNNQINIYLHFGKIEKAKTLLKEKSPYLPNAFKETCISLNYARIEFEIGNYEKSLKLLKFTPASADFYYFINYKILSLKCHIMNDDIESINIENKQITIYIQRTKNLKPEIKSGLLNLFKIIPHLSVTNFKLVSKNKYKKLYKLVLSNIPFSEKTWVKERFKELSKKYNNSLFVELNNKN